MKKCAREVCCTLFLVIIGVLIFVFGSSYSSAMAVLSGDVGPAYFPRLIGASLIVLGSIHGTIESVKWFGERKVAGKVTDEVANENQGAVKADPKGGIYSIILIMAYCFTLDFLGFVIASTIYLFLQILIFSYRQEKKMLKPAIIVSLIIPITIYLIWYLGFKVPLPSGLLPLHLWL